MLVLNTTSPPVSPGAPAASPSYQSPFSSASVAFMVCVRANRSRGTPPRRDPRARRPRPMIRQLQPDDVGADADFGDAGRRRAGETAVDQDARAARPGVHVDRSRKCATRACTSGRRRGAAAGGRRTRRRRSIAPECSAAGGPPRLRTGSDADSVTSSRADGESRSDRRGQSSRRTSSRSA